MNSIKASSLYGIIYHILIDIPPELIEIICSYTLNPLYKEVFENKYEFMTEFYCLKIINNFVCATDKINGKVYICDKNCKVIKIIDKTIVPNFEPFCISKIKNYICVSNGSSDNICIFDNDFKYLYTLQIDYDFNICPHISSITENDKYIYMANSTNSNILVFNKSVFPQSLSIISIINNVNCKSVTYVNDCLYALGLNLNDVVQIFKNNEIIKTFGELNLTDTTFDDDKNNFYLPWSIDSICNGLDIEIYIADLVGKVKVFDEKGNPKRNFSSTSPYCIAVDDHHVFVSNSNSISKYQRQIYYL